MQAYKGPEKNQEMAAAILSNIGDGVISTDKTGRIIYMNKIAEEILECSKTESVGRLFHEVFIIYNSETKQPAFNPVAYVLETNSRTGLHNNTVLILDNHKEKFISATCTPAKDVKGKMVGVVVVFRDITRLKTLDKQLITAKEAAEAANKAKSEFLANMSHEIRTPINGVVGMLELTLLSNLNNDQRDNLVTAKACAQSLLSIINDVLDFSKMEAGKMTLESTDFNLNDLIEEIIRAHSVKASEKGLELSYSLTSSIPKYLVGDPNRLRQVLNNLISNAIKFTMKGEINVKLKNLLITKDEAEIEFNVTDTGIGIAKEDMSKLFESFSQIENNYTRQYGGTGLGLVISKQLVKMMGGEIGVESELGKGSNFHFTLKFKIGKPIIIAKQPMAFISKAEKPLRILLVEDDRINRKVILKMLNEMGHNVNTADNGMEALEHCAGQVFDVILMDIQMPKMNGIEATSRIRQSENGNKGVPIIAMTAYALPGDKEKFLNLGMDAYISKPILIDALYQVLNQVTQKIGYELPRKVILTDINEVKFTSDSTIKQANYSPSELNQISDRIKHLADGANWCNISIIENTANEIKNIAGSLDLTDIKDTAFKIELAARRGNMEESRKYIEQIAYEFKLYESTNE